MPKTLEDLNRVYTNLDKNIERLKTDSMTSSMSDNEKKFIEILSDILQDVKKAEYQGYLNDENSNGINEHYAIIKKFINIFSTHVPIEAMNPRRADDLLRPQSGEYWNLLSKEEKEALYEYTVGSGFFNRYKRNIGMTPYDKQSLYFKKSIEYVSFLEEALSKCTLQNDMWLFRGSDKNALACLLNVEIKLISIENIDELNEEFVGQMRIDDGFFSTGSSPYTGFGGEVAYRILARKGIHGMYVEPFSEFGATATDGNWDGIQGSKTIGGEAEFLMQCGTKFKVLKIEFINYNITVTLETLN